MGTKTRSAGRVPQRIAYRGDRHGHCFQERRTNIPERFRQHAEGKLAKIGKLDHKAIRIDVEITQERNPRQSKGRSGSS